VGRKRNRFEGGGGGGFGVGAYRLHSVLKEREIQHGDSPSLLSASEKIPVNMVEASTVKERMVLKERKS